MPQGYEDMRDRFKADGLDDAAAKAKAARIWNADHPNNPVTRASATEEAKRRLRER